MSGQDNQPAVAVLRPKSGEPFELDSYFEFLSDANIIIHRGRHYVLRALTDSDIPRFVFEEVNAPSILT